MYRFADPYFLYILLIIPALIYLHVRQRKPRSITLRYSHLGIVKAAAKSRWNLYRRLLLALRMLFILFLILARYIFFHAGRRF